MHDGEFSGQAFSVLLISPNAYKESSSSLAVAVFGCSSLVAPTRRKRVCLLPVKIPEVAPLNFVNNTK